MIGALRTLGLTVDGDGHRADGQRPVDPPGRRHDRLRPGGHGAAVRSAGGRAGTRARSRSTATSRPAPGPIAPLLDALRGLGVGHRRRRLCRSRCAAAGRCAGGTVEIDASASSQFVSGLLLSGAAFTDGLTIVHTGESVPSAPHVAMTVAMLREAGVDVDDTQANRWRVVPRPGRRAALGRSSPTCPTRCRSSPRPWSPAARCASRAGRRPASSPPTPSSAS